MRGNREQAIPFCMVKCEKCEVPMNPLYPVSLVAKHPLNRGQVMCWCEKTGCRPFLAVDLWTILFKKEMKLDEGTVERHPGVILQKMAYDFPEMVKVVVRSYFVLKYMLEKFPDGKDHSPPGSGPELMLNSPATPKTPKLNDEQAKQLRVRQMMKAANGTPRLTFMPTPSSLKKETPVKDEPKSNVYRSPQGMNLHSTNQPIHAAVAYK